ncbi:methyltransferase domain-containing protein [Kistimonas scapharcae]|uniref:Methyltransferase domain-containing protein n=1 Tax=Kistimonas scapharcae TaxID=1036133 RepID=A0ABP8V220_9GAMM
MDNLSHYVIRSGTEGAKRMRLIAPLIATDTNALLDRVGLNNGLECLDIGCGNGAVSLELARRVGPDGHVTGGDIDDIKLTMARTEAHLQGIENVTFKHMDVRNMHENCCYDVIYARFLLTHLPSPSQALNVLYQHLSPGGSIILEDIDFKGNTSYPDCPALERYQALYCTCVKQRGGDPFIGIKLPSLLRQNHFTNIRMAAVQNLGMEGDIKLISAITMENIADSLLNDGLASTSEIDEIITELYAFANNPDTIAGMPRVIQAWGYRPINE